MHFSVISALSVILASSVMGMPQDQADLPVVEGSNPMDDSSNSVETSSSPTSSIETSSMPTSFNTSMTAPTNSTTLDTGTAGNGTAYTTGNSTFPETSVLNATVKTTVQSTVQATETQTETQTVVLPSSITQSLAIEN